MPVVRLAKKKRVNLYLRVWGRLIFIILLLNGEKAFCHGGELEEVTITGRRQSATGQEVSAAKGSFSAQTLQNLPVENAGDLLQLIPGLVASQHSGSGKASQYYLRGFNLDHGSDFATYVDLMPVNMVSHGHGQGYTDLNFVIPELISGMHYRKGPYYVDSGDFSAAGNAHFHSAAFLTGNRFKLEAGSFGYRRIFAAAQKQQGLGNWMLGVEWQGYEGPWVNQDESINKQNLWLKYASGNERAGVDASFMSYRNTWNAADQIPLRAISNGSISEYSTIDPSSGGEAYRDSLSMQRRWHGERSQLMANVYLVRSGLDLWSNFTYFFKPEGDQFFQQDKRYIAGGDLVHSRSSQLFGRESLHSFGLQLRSDYIHSVGLFDAVERKAISVQREDEVQQHYRRLYWQSTVLASEKLRLTGGLGMNFHQFKLMPLQANSESTLEVNRGKQADEVLTGALRLAYQVTDNLEFLANVGRNYHSNDARGIISRQNPQTGEATSRVRPLVPVGGLDAGLSWRSSSKRLSASMSGWVLNSDEVLVYAGDEGTTVDGGGEGRRKGLEATFGVNNIEGMDVQLDIAFTDAIVRVQGDSGKEDNIMPGTLSEVFGVRMSKTFLGPWAVNMSWRYFGSYLLENGMRAEPSRKLDGGIQYLSDVGFIIRLDILNVLDSNDSEVEYGYASQLPGEQRSVEDRHLRRLSPRSLRLKVEYEFD